MRELDSNEIWKPVVGYEGSYEVSTLGRVKSLSRTVNCNTGVCTLPERILRGHINHDGYIRYELRKNGCGKKILGHIIVMSAFTEVPTGCEVNHINLIKSDNRLENLEWVSHKENMTHALENGALQNRRGRATKKVIDLDNGKVFARASDAASHFKVGLTTIYGACSGRHKVKGHCLRYE